VRYITEGKAFSYQLVPGRGSTSHDEAEG